jgi:oligopeptide transport system ATP-binding protein
MDRLVTAANKLDPTTPDATPPLTALPGEPAPVDAPPGAPLVRLEDVHVRYEARTGLLSRGSVPVLAVDGVSLTVERGRSLGIVGATGSGKSTIAQVVMGMVRPTSGSVEIVGRRLDRLHGRERSAVQRRVQVVMQDPYSSLDPRMRVGAIIAEPMTLGRRPIRPAAASAVRDRVAELLTLVGLSPDKARLYPHQFSGGQRQRIAIARALAPRPELIVLDEPTSALDVSVRAQILNLLKSLQDQLEVTYVIISHDLVTVAYLASTVAVMQLGRVMEIGPTATMYRHPRHPYTVELLASVPGASSALMGAPLPPSAVAAVVPAGSCRFAPRCWLRTRLGDPARCVDEEPALTTIAPGHDVACHFHAELGELEAASAPVAAAPGPSVDEVRDR